jgi:tetratricopeptide (TPR) repeat protein
VPEDALKAGVWVEVVRAAVLGELGQRDRWLLVFDNAGDPADIRSWLPGGPGHVLITSREHRWAEIAVPVEVDVLARAESVAILRDRVAGLGAADAGRLAAQLGDLPLAIAQAAGFMAETRMTAGDYLGSLATRAGKLLAQGEIGSYPGSLAAATGLIADRLVSEDPVAAELASLCAFFASDPIPEDLFTSAAGELPGELADRAADPLAWRQTLARLARQSLARIDQRGLVMHRLTQAILRDRLTSEEAAAAGHLNDEYRRTLEQTVARLLAAARLGEPDDQSNWQMWAQIVPHLLSAPALANVDEDEALRRRLDDAGSYLFWLGDAPARRQLYEVSYRRRKRSLGPDHHDTLASAGGLAYAMNELGDHERALELQRDTYKRCRRVLGPEDRETLYAANALAIFLHDSGELERARELHEETFQHRLRLFPDDPDWLYSANRLASVLRELGDTARARDLFEETYEKCGLMLGPDSLETLNVAGQRAGAGTRRSRGARSSSPTPVRHIQPVQPGVRPPPYGDRGIATGTRFLKPSVSGSGETPGATVTGGT